VDNIIILVLKSSVKCSINNVIHNPNPKSKLNIFNPKPIYNIHIFIDVIINKQPNEPIIILNIKHYILPYQSDKNPNAKPLHEHAYIMTGTILNWDSDRFSLSLISVKKKEYNIALNT